MANQLTTNKDNEQLELLSNSKGISGSGKVTNHASVVDIEFKAQNSYTFGKTTIKAVDVSISEAHFTGDKTEDELMLEASNDRKSSQLLLDSGNNPSQLVIISENSLAQIDNEDPIDTLEGVFKDLTKLKTVEESYEAAIQKGKIAITLSKSKTYSSIKDGILKIDYFTYKNYADNREFKSFDQVQKQIDLDNSLSIEEAEVLNNKLYQDFPILNSSTPIISSLNRKVVNQ
jgi:hypothetical protein